MIKPNIFSFFLSPVLLSYFSVHIALADIAKKNDLSITRNAVETNSGQVIPIGAFGIVKIAKPRQATLLDLRGMAGSGDVILRSHERGYCLTFPLRFVAGDFGGDKISTYTVDPVEFIIKSRRVAKALADGVDIISEDYRVDNRDHPDAEIIIATGLGEDFGFVLNPGRNLWTELWGIKISRISCSPRP